MSSVVASLLVVRHGTLIFERYFNGFDAADAKHVHSLGKSITSLVTGIAIDEGLLELDTRIDEILASDQVGENGELTVRDLLTMSAGLEVPDPEWAYEPEPTDPEPSLIRMVLASKRISDPGTEFVYSTGLTEVLAAVLAEATGMSFCEYAADRLLGPLGIDVEGWHVQPDGYFAAGPTFITPREIARVGQLVLDGGIFEEHRLVSQTWVDASLTQRWELGCLRYPPLTERYGYLWWGYRIGGYDTWIASGSGAQDLAVVPALDLVAVITHDTIQTEGRRVPMPALLYELLLGAAEGAPQPQEDAVCAPRPDTMATIAADGSGARSIVPGWPAGTWGPLSPDGGKLAFSTIYLGFWDLYMIGVDGIGETRVTHDEATDAMPAWSRDGELLAFTRGEPSQGDLHLIAPDGSGLRRLTELDGYEQAPTWSPDGKRIAFIWGHQEVSGWGQPGELWVIDRDGSNLRQLRQQDTTNPEWSPDGRHILFDSITAAGHVGVLDLSTGTETDLGEGFLPAWSPDGTRIVFGVLDGESGSDLYTMAADGSDRMRLTSDPDFDTAPQWSPDGSTIVYWTTPPGS
jgi:CubicO group peptidase (beta-lactamase class C family)